MFINSTDAPLLTIFFQRAPSLFSGAENTLETNMQVQDRPMKAAEPELLLQKRKKVNTTCATVY